MFAKTFGCIRFIYSKMLGDRFDHYKETGKKLNNTLAQYKYEFPWLKEVDSMVLANAQLNLNRAYNNFWNNRKHFGKPRFKSKKTGHFSYFANNRKGSVRLEKINSNRDNYCEFSNSVKFYPFHLMRKNV
ncbi:transposase [Pectinatus frisingensis]|uniref:transposase n=1 Tax=Pectinatus frisingensis TaxID=865 RepID=UPI0022AB39A1|nr:transposase [Pectinatus frisingensis]